MQVYAQDGKQAQTAVCPGGQSVVKPAHWRRASPEGAGREATKPMKAITVIVRFLNFIYGCFSNNGYEGNLMDGNLASLNSV
jgi:hypothetical protein